MLAVSTISQQLDCEALGQNRNMILIQVRWRISRRNSYGQMVRAFAAILPKIALVILLIFLKQQTSTMRLLLRTPPKKMIAVMMKKAMAKGQ